MPNRPPAPRNSRAGKMPSQDIDNPHRQKAAERVDRIYDLPAGRGYRFAVTFTP